jgi:hypothetical protein
MEDAVTYISDPVSAEKRFNLYPNPSEGNLTLELENGFTGPVQMALYSSEGKTLRKCGYDKTGSVFRETLEFKGLPGLYLVRLMAGGITYERWFVLDHQTIQ